MRKKIFQELYKENSQFQRTIPVLKDVAIAFWKLLMAESYSVTNHFGVQKSKVILMVVQVCKVINALIYLWVVAITKVLKNHSCV